MPRFWRGVLAAWAVRIGFVFTAIAVPSLFTTIIKNIIGRARPFVVVGPDVWAYEPFTWHARYASFPSGHATTAFAALVAIGAIFPQARALMWIYAVLIALSRVMLTAHHPSDVIGGAIVGAVGAVLVRNWFADRSLGFSVVADGSVLAMPGPNIRRIIKSVARRLHSAEKVA
jgi:undecaprenyl-diphosphatase